MLRFWLYFIKGTYNNHLLSTDPDAKSTQKKYTCPFVALVEYRL